jgi:hypothetical protein
MRAKQIYVFGILRKYEDMGSESAADRELTETILVSLSTMKKVINAITAGTGIRARNTPDPVATPFPPLNPRNGIVMCPRREDTPISTQ